jgi:hypothetical protein
LEARQHIDKPEQSSAQRIVFQRPIDHSAQQIASFEDGRLVLCGARVKRARLTPDLTIDLVYGYYHMIQFAFVRSQEQISESHGSPEKDTGE